MQEVIDKLAEVLSTHQHVVELYYDAGWEGTDKWTADVAYMVNRTDGDSKPDWINIHSSTLSGLLIEMANVLTSPVKAINDVDE